MRMRTRFGILLLYVISLFECQVGQDEVKLEPSKLPPSIKENTYASYLYYVRDLPVEVVNSQLRDFKYEELLPLKGLLKIEPFIPRSIILQIVRGRFDLELIALANTFEESDFTDFTEKEVFDLLREDLGNGQSNLEHVYSFMIYSFKKYPSVAVFNQFRYFSRNLSSFLVQLRMLLINGTIDEQSFLALRNLNWVNAFCPFYHPILHAYIVLKELKSVSYSTPVLLSRIGLGSEWYTNLTDAQIIAEILKIGDLVTASDAPDPTDDILFTINTLLIGCHGTIDSILPTILQVFQKRGVKFYEDLCKFVTDDQPLSWIKKIDIPWNKGQSYQYVSFELAGSTLVYDFLKKGNGEDAMAILSVMINHQVPCIPIDSACDPLSCFAKMGFTDALSRNNDANLRKKYCMTDDETRMDYAWLQSCPKFVAYPMLSLVRPSELERILHDCPVFEPIERVNAVVQGIQGFALVKGDKGPFMQGTDAKKRRKDFEQFVQSKEAWNPMITQAIVSGLNGNPFLRLLQARRLYTSPFYPELNLRPLICRLLDQCHFSAIEELSSSKIFSWDLNCEPSIYDLKLGAFYVYAHLAPWPSDSMERFLLREHF